MIKKLDNNSYFFEKLNNNLKNNMLIKNISNNIDILNRKNKDNYMVIKLFIEEKDIGKGISF